MIGLTVCSGIGAPEHAAPWIDWRWQSEIEPFPCAVLRHRFPGATNLGDMTKFQEWPDAAIDVLCGGTPCQDYSIAGKRAGMAGERGGLTRTYVDIAGRYRPRWVVWENVPGVLSTNGGRDFAAFLGDLGQCGYGWAYRVLDVQFGRTLRFPWAIPQRRRRVFVVGYLGDWRRAAAVLFDRESLSGHPPPRREAGKGAAPTLSARTKGGGGLGTDFDLDGGLVANSGDVSHCICASAQQSLDAEVETLLAQPVAHALRGEGFDASEDGTGRGTPLVAFSSKDYGADAMQGCSPTLRAGGHDGSHPNAGIPPAVAFDARQSEVIQYGEITGPLDTDGATMGVLREWAVRRLTPLECERLMGFEDGWTQVPYRGKPAADGPRYKALGNSWGVNAGEFVFDRIRMIEGMADAA